MTKAEAIDALSSGKKVTHHYYYEDEWVVEINGFYQFEDGVKSTPDEFWSLRSAKSWQDGWELFS